MATVRITDNLVHSILANVLQPLNKKMESLKLEIRESFRPDDVYAKLVGPLLPHMEALPDDFIQRYDEFAVEFKHGNYSDKFKLKLAKKQPIPYQWRETYQKPPQILADTPGFLRAAQAAERWAPVNAEAHQLELTLKNLLKNCTTLKQALAVWPNLIHHLPKDTLEKHHERVERKTPEKVAVSMGPLPDNIQVSLAKVTLLKDTSA